MFIARKRNLFATRIYLRGVFSIRAWCNLFVQIGICLREFEFQLPSCGNLFATIGIYSRGDEFVHENKGFISGSRGETRGPATKPPCWEELLLPPNHHPGSATFADPSPQERYFRRTTIPGVLIPPVHHHGSANSAGTTTPGVLIPLNHHPGSANFAQPPLREC